MKRKLVLFDIDGTLLLTHGAGRRAIHAALRAEVDLHDEPDGVRFDGKTDPQIVRELLDRIGHPDADSDPKIDAVCERYVALLETELRRHECQPTVFPGVVSLLARLAAHDDLVVGLLTGNLERGAVLKLRAAGIAPEQFRIGAFGSDASQRAQLPAIAARRAVLLMGRQPGGADVVILGDTPADMQCGAGIGARAIGVGTGSYTADELMAVGGFAAFSDLSDTDAVVAAVYA